MIVLHLESSRTAWADMEVLRVVLRLVLVVAIRLFWYVVSAAWREFSVLVALLICETIELSTVGVLRFSRILARSDAAEEMLLATDVLKALAVVLREVDIAWRRPVSVAS